MEGSIPYRVLLRVLAAGYMIAGHASQTEIFQFVLGSLLEQFTHHLVGKINSFLHLLFFSEVRYEFDLVLDDLLHAQEHAKKLTFDHFEEQHQVFSLVAAFQVEPRDHASSVTLVLTFSHNLKVMAFYGPLG